MNQFEEYKKMYMEKKKEYLECVSDLEYIKGLIKKYGKHDNLISISSYLERRKGITFSRMEYMARCLFDMTIPHALFRPARIDDIDTSFKVTLNMRLDENNELSYNTYFVITIHILRDWNYYSRVITDESVLSDIMKIYFSKVLKGY